MLPDAQFSVHTHLSGPCVVVVSHDSGAIIIHPYISGELAGNLTGSSLMQQPDEYERQVLVFCTHCMTRSNHTLFGYEYDAGTFLLRFMLSDTSRSRGSGSLAIAMVTLVTRHFFEKARVQKGTRAIRMTFFTSCFGLKYFDQLHFNGEWADLPHCHNGGREFGGIDGRITSAIYYYWLTR